MSTLIQPPAPTPAAPHRTDPALRRLLAGLAAIFALAGVASLALALLQLGSRDVETVRTAYRGVNSVRLDTGAGDVSVVQGARGTPVRVTARITRSFNTPQRTDHVSDGVLMLSGNCDSWFGDCGVDYDVTVPPGTRVDANVGSGDVSITGLRTRAPLVVRGGSGDLDLSDVSAPSVDLRVGSGEVTADLRRSPLVAVKLGSGDLTLALAGAPHRVRASTGSGDIDLTVPAAPSYRIETDTGSGDVTADAALVRDDRSSRLLSVSAGSGDIDLRAGR
jgi:putative adhesin